MSVPGAEHPDKIANIVKGKGALEGMRGLYGEFFEDGNLGLTWDVRAEEVGTGRQVEKGNQGGWEWRGSGEGLLRVSWR